MARIVQFVLAFFTNLPLQRRTVTHKSDLAPACRQAGSFLPPTETFGGQAFTKPSLSGHFLYTGR
jgi:hypothetical protein